MSRQQGNLTLGIDPGTATTGYGLVQGGADLRLVECGIISTPAELPLAERLRMIFASLGQIIDQHRPDGAAVEQLFFSRNARTALAVGHARGVVLLALAMKDLPLFEYTPLQVKQAVTGYGRAGKPQVQAMVRVLLHLEAAPQPDDAADAVAVAICHAQASRLRQRLGV